MRWTKEELSPLADGEEYLLVLNAASFHRTPLVLQALKDINVTVAMIPAELMNMIQPLSTAINKPFKQWLQEAYDRRINEINP